MGVENSILVRLRFGEPGSTQAPPPRISRSIYNLNLITLKSQNLENSKVVIIIIIIIIIILVKTESTLSDLIFWLNEWVLCL